MTMPALLFDAIQPDEALRFRYQWLASLLSDYPCTLVVPAKDMESTAVLPRLILTESAFHWRGKKHARRDALQKLMQQQAPCIWVTDQIQALSISSAPTIWIGKDDEIEATGLQRLPVSPWIEPPEWEYLATVCETEANGFHYFCCSADALSEMEIMHLLKAFSLFKKWQQSSLQLILTWEYRPSFSASFQEKVQTFKYRGDVQWRFEIKPNQKANLLAAAYAYLHFGQAQQSWWMIAAATLFVPVIASLKRIHASPVAAHICAASLEKEQAVGQEMIRLYKDETYRSQKVQAAHQAALPFTGLPIIQQWRDVLEK
jgi:hypothetical protein